MATKKLANRIIFSLLISIALTSCGGNSTNSNHEERTMTYIVNHPDDVGKYGEGTYINMNSEYTDRDGIRWSKDNIFAPGPGESLSDEKFQRKTSGNQYGKGYEQGQEDASRGLDANPDGYGGNGQFEKGYEDGYEDW